MGSGYSFSPLPVTDDIALDLSALTGVVRVDGGKIRVRAGTTLGELNAALADRGLTVATLSDVGAPTVAGAIATGTHGSLTRTGSLSAQVTGFRVVESSGMALEVPADELDGHRTALGALGVITEVELAVIPELVLRVSQGRLPLDEALAPDYLDAHRWAEFAVFPYAVDALARWADEVVDQPAPPSAMRTLERRLVRTAAVGGGVALGRTVPRLVPTINRAATRWERRGSVTDLAYRALGSHPILRWEESEWALPRAAVSEAVRDLLAQISARGLDVGFPLEVRVGPAETGWLHPAHGRDTAWVAVHSALGTDPEPLSMLAAQVLGAHQGRPHWGKRHPWTAEQVAAGYPRLADFRAVRDRRDPHRVFTNSYVATLLGP